MKRADVDPVLLGNPAERHHVDEALHAAHLGELGDRVGEAPEPQEVLAAEDVVLGLHRDDVRPRRRRTRAPRGRRPPGAGSPVGSSGSVEGSMASASPGGSKRTRGTRGQQGERRHRDEHGARIGDDDGGSPCDRRQRRHEGEGQQGGEHERRHGSDGGFLAAPGGSRRPRGGADTTAVVGRGGSRHIPPVRHVGAWRSLVARFVRDEEVAGSNPVAPTMPGPLRRLGSSGPLRSGQVTHPAAPVVRDRLADLLGAVHHEGALADDGLADRRAAEEQRASRPRRRRSRMLSPARSKSATSAAPDRLGAARPAARRGAPRAPSCSRPAARAPSARRPRGAGPRRGSA